MIKKTVLTVLGLGVMSVLLFGRDACSYVSTTYGRITGAIEESVPVEFQIDRARDMVANLQPEIRNSMHIIAKEEVELEKLNSQISDAQERTAKEKSHIMRLQSDLQSNRQTFRYANQTYTADEVKQDLSRKFNRFKVADDTLTNLTEMRNARAQNLDAAQQKLTAVINARRKLEVDIENLEAKRKLVDVAAASSEYRFDDSQLARAKELIGDIRTRLDVQAKLANADVNLHVGIQLDDATPEDITGQVAEYFGLEKAGDDEFANASFASER